MPSRELQVIVDTIRSQPVPKTPPTLPEMRAAMEAMGPLFPVAGDVRCTPVEAGGVRAEWIVPPGVSDDRVVLYLHGGGYVMGSINTHRQLASRVARSSGSRALLIDYRLAPEHPHPAALEDAAASYRWVLEQGIEPERVAVAGDSAGGGLTVAALVALRDRGTPLPSAAVCISPWVDLEGLGQSMKTKADVDPMVRREDILRMARAYLPAGDLRDPRAAPLYANLAGLPPLLIQAGTAETLLDDAVRLAERARNASVDVTFEPWEDMIHVWHFFAAQLPEGREAIERIGEFLRSRLG